MNRLSLQRQLRISDVVFAACISAIIGVYCELYREYLGSVFRGTEMYLLVGKAGPSTILFIAFFFVLSFAIIALVAWAGKRIGEFCFRWRYALAGIALAALVALQISGSSLACWGTILSGKGFSELQGVLFGVPRWIRGDEWVVFTPQAFSQSYTGYAAYSDIMRGVSTDVTMVYAQPSWALATVFRPFLWGYLALGSQFGLAFFWCARLITLFMVSFEFGRFITDDHRLLALAYALLIALAPIIQWWFAINGTAELLICAQALVLAFAAWRTSDTPIKCVGLSLLFAYFAGCFVMVLYPAWQVGIGYGIVALLVAVLIANRSHKPQSPSMPARIAILTGCLAVLFALLAIVLMSSWDTIQTITHTVYPGQTSATGGGLFSKLFNYTASWFAPTIEHAGATPNASEFSSFFTLFPLGIVLGLCSLRYRRDPFVISLLVADIILLLYGCFGFPEWLAKITLLSHIQSTRLDMSVGFIETILLIRSCTVIAAQRSARANELSTKSSLIPAAIAICAALGATLITYCLINPALNTSPFMPILSFAFIACSVYAIAKACHHERFGGYVLAVSFVVLVTGLCVNPLQQGAAELTESQLASDVQQTITESGSTDNLWIADADELSQAALASGAPTLTSVATYPSLDTWRKIDPSGKYESVYNRYAHIRVKPTTESTSFELVQNDLFEIKLNPDDAVRLGATFWISKEDLSRYNTGKTVFTPLVKSGNGIAIYRITQD